MKTYQWMAATLGMFSCLVAGCGGETSNPDLRAASGTVTQSGQPLADATISFVPAVANEGQAATGVTDSKGHFELSTFTKGDGALIGNYKVSVSKANPEYEMPEPGETEAAPHSLLPEKLGNPETSGLGAEVKADGENVFQFDLQEAE